MRMAIRKHSERPRPKVPATEQSPATVFVVVVMTGLRGTILPSVPSQAISVISTVVVAVTSVEPSVFASVTVIAKSAAVGPPLADRYEH